MAADKSGSIQLVGLDEIRATLKQLPVEVRQKVLGVAVKRAAAPVVNAAKSFAARSERTGALRESITAIVKKGRDGNSYAVVGPARGYFRGGKKLGKNADNRGADMPAKYGHLVEFGHHVVAPKKGASRRKNTATTAKTGKTWVAARPFMRPALLATQDIIARELAEGVLQGIDQSLARIRKNPAARG
jgi:HK97 gp10 family phage protein